MKDKTPSEEFNKPVIGKIWAQINDLPEDEFEVIDIIEDEGNKTYLCNCWNGDRVQLVPGFLVKRYEEK